MNCRKCLKETPDESKFCIHCGESTEEKIVTCPNCSETIVEGAMYCHSCGVKVKEYNHSVERRDLKKKRNYFVSAKKYIIGSLSILLSILLVISLFVSNGNAKINNNSTTISGNDKVEINYNFIKNISGIKYLFMEKTMSELTIEMNEYASEIADKYDLDQSNVSDQKKLSELMIKKFNPAIIYSINEYSEITTIQKVFFIILVITQLLTVILIPFLLIYGILIMFGKDKKFFKVNDVLQYLTFVGLGLVFIANQLYVSSNRYVVSSSTLVLFIIGLISVFSYKLVDLILSKRINFKGLIKTSVSVIFSITVFILVVNSGIRYNYQSKPNSGIKKSIAITETAKSFTGTMDKLVPGQKLNIKSEELKQSFFQIIEYSPNSRTTKDLLHLMDSNTWAIVDETGSDMDVLVTLTSIISITTFIVLATIVLIVMLRFIYQPEKKSKSLLSLQIISLMLIIAQIVLLIITSMTMNQYFGFFDLDRGTRTLYTSVSIAQYFGLVITIGFLVFNIVYKDKRKNY
ncbi:zinc ribbon domain-containing protein [Haploplasma axanthum]|uniref:DZANK-type domain-containing protein n=1 Tax=Haploplasma axanthum TaxID=29552 RepID=A0A449BCQ6_HAPAX|nr:zinc ribbon domain-containing protein [Haploplasma axanthum]VEU80224.1 putative protein serine/threonine phosphatase [Haploplasma axanthum]